MPPVDNDWVCDTVLETLDDEEEGASWVERADFCLGAL